MAKLSQKHLDEILYAFAGYGDNPSKALIAVLARLSGKFDDDIEDRYVNIYKEGRGDDQGPFDAIPPSRG